MVIDQIGNSVDNSIDKNLKRKFSWEIVEALWWEAEIEDTDIVEYNEQTPDNSYLSQLGDGMPDSDNVQLDAHISGDQELMNNWFSDNVQYDSHISWDSELIHRQHNKPPYDAHFWG